jgi:uncharacterized repeat protein (TIGR03837 family)
VSATAPRPDWDIFCKVIDNLGDIGVCWRIARQLAGEYALRVRLWVDDLDRFRLLCPQLDVTLPIQRLQGVEICRWDDRFQQVTPARVVLETFACRIPDAFVEQIAHLAPPPVWINLDYLSAEGWVARFHAQPSPHACLPLIKYFFFPGFAADTGGLLREQGLRARRVAFIASADLQRDWWRQFGFAPPLPGTLLISLFAYENPAISDLLHACEVSERSVCCLVPWACRLPAIEAYAGRPLRSGDIFRRGALEIRLLPFVEQSRYDQMLWLCNLNFVRGEDSFVRAQWAARPLVWQIYPQADGAHLVKLNAFLDLYCAALPPTTSSLLRQFWQAWNAGTVERALWTGLAAGLPGLHEHAMRWDEELALQDDLLSRLLRFSSSKL